MPLLGSLDPGTAFGALRRAAATVTERVRPDHRAITLRSVRFFPQNMVRLYLYATVAPSRWAAREFDDGQVRRAAAFVALAFPGVFDPVPETADDSTILFANAGDDHLRDEQLYVHRTGLVEVLWPLFRGTLEEPVWLDAEEAARVVMQLADAVGAPEYAELSAAGRGRRRFAKVDWFFHVATGTTSPEGGRYDWKGIRFPDTTPPRSRQEWVAAPLDGYGAGQLRNTRRRGTSEHVTRVFLSELLAANGYYDFSDAVSTTITYATKRPTPEEGGEAQDGPQPQS